MHDGVGAAIFLLLLPPVASFSLGKTEGAIWNLILLGCGTFALYMTGYEVWRTAATLIDFVFVFVLISITVFAYENIREKSNKIAAEHQAHLHLEIASREEAEVEKQKLIEKLSVALRDIRELSGLVPICASCKKIRTDAGYWEQIEQYLHRHSQLRFTHVYCSDCSASLEEGDHI